MSSASKNRINESVESGELTESSFDDSLDSTTLVSEGDSISDSIKESDTSLIKQIKSDDVVDKEREEGDGQEYESEETDEDGELRGGTSSDEEDAVSVATVNKEKKLDDDEDRRNPQYIPKRGTFYEHDDRTADDDTTTTNAETEADRLNEQSADKKKVWKEHENRWNHDMYNDDEQAPKSKEELLEAYGYDIRNEEGPPKARRRRRYGRGPNKYTRNWEDEGAYNQGGGGGGGRRGGSSRGGGSDDERSDKRNSQTFYNNKVSGRGGGGGGGNDRGGRRDKEAFPALPNNQDTSPSTSSSRDERPANNNAGTAWSRNKENNTRSQQPPSAGPRDDYPKINANRPLQLTPPPQRRDVEVTRLNQAGPTRHPQEDREPIKRSSGRGMTSRRGKPFEQSPPHNGRGGAPGNSRDRPNARQSQDVRAHDQPRQSQDARLASHDIRPNDGPGFWSKSQEREVPKLKTQDDLANDLARMSIYTNQNAASQQQQTGEHVPSREFTRRQDPPNKSNNSSYGQQPQQQQQQQQQGDRRQTVVPPRLQQDTGANRPKRYSSLRQRSLPESGAPILPPQQQQQQQQQQTYAQPQPQHQYYQPSYVQQALPPQQPPLQLIQTVHPPPTTYTGPTFIQPAPLMCRPPSPTHYLPAPPLPQAVYVQQPYPGPFQGFAAVAPSPQSAELGLYQPQRTTFYETKHQVMSRVLTQRRQRSAIPIVPPPERYSRGRGRISDQEQFDAGGTGDTEQYSPTGDYQEDDTQYDDHPEAEVMADGSGDATPAVRSDVARYDEPEAAAHEVPAVAS